MIPSERLKPPSESSDISLLKPHVLLLCLSQPQGSRQRFPSPGNAAEERQGDGQITKAMLSIFSCFLYHLTLPKCFDGCSFSGAIKEHSSAACWVRWWFSRSCHCILTPCLQHRAANLYPLKAVEMFCCDYECSFHVIDLMLYNLQILPQFLISGLLIALIFSDRCRNSSLIIYSLSSLGQLEVLCSSIASVEICMLCVNVFSSERDNSTYKAGNISFQR